MNIGPAHGQQQTMFVSFQNKRKKLADESQDEEEEAAKAAIKAERVRVKNAKKRKDTTEEETKEAVSKDEATKEDTTVDTTEAPITRSPSRSARTRSMDVSRSHTMSQSKSQMQYQALDDIRPPKVHLKLVQVEVEAGRPLDLVLSTNLVIRTVSKYSIAFYSVIVGDQVSLKCHVI
ncbi:hypothetical protein TELCIR_13517 [Teladorsagia circumcincta]|uniref:Uncharacterized protein n=1 Tax=Teladorsagia circumcincta TaxID=45464 RepID=A0A2G9U3L2_TELCI|nr:hypothetical protein TELCIR_13517 [Teladorsagia circumcincta]